MSDESATPHVKTEASAKHANLIAEAPNCHQMLRRMFEQWQYTSTGMAKHLGLVKAKLCSGHRPVHKSGRSKKETQKVILFII